MREVEFSIIIPTKDRPDLLQQAIGSIKAHCRQADYEIIVVETGQAESSLGIPSDVRFLPLPGATYAQANNAGAKGARGKYLVLCNNDIILQDNVLQAFRLAMLRHEGQWIIGARLLYPDGLVQHAGVGFDQEGGPYNLWRLAPKEHPEVVWSRRLPAVTFALALVPRAVWQELEGLDEGFTNSYEDVDFCLRATEIGYSVVYDSGVCAVHLEGQTAGRNDNVERSWRYYQQKWLSTNRIRYVLGQWPFSAVRG